MDNKFVELFTNPVVNECEKFYNEWITSWIDYCDKTRKEYFESK